jgi:hypothetical protein
MDSHTPSPAPIASAMEQPTLQYPGKLGSSAKIARCDGYFGAVNRRAMPAFTNA